MGATNLKDAVSGIRTVQALVPANLTATTNGTAIDASNATLINANALAFSVNVGVFSSGLDGSNLLTVTFQKSVDSGFSVPVAVDSADIYGALREDGATWDLLLNDSTDESKSFRVGVRLDPGFAFYRAVFTETGTVAGDIGATAILATADAPEA